jgi:hypothetical protein
MRVPKVEWFVPLPQLTLSPLSLAPLSGPVPLSLVPLGPVPLSPVSLSLVPLSHSGPVNESICGHDGLQARLPHESGIYPCRSIWPTDQA